MTDEPMTLQEIGDHFNISRERARQIEKVFPTKSRSILIGSEGKRPAKNTVHGAAPEGHVTSIPRSPAGRCEKGEDKLCIGKTERGKRTCMSRES